MSNYAVNKGGELPPAPNRAVYPFEDLEVGDTFFVPYAPGVDPHTPEQKKQGQIRIYAAVAHHNRTKAPRRFAARTGDEGMTVGRVA